MVVRNLYLPTHCLGNSSCGVWSKTNITACPLPCWNKNVCIEIYCVKKFCCEIIWKNSCRFGGIAINQFIIVLILPTIVTSQTFDELLSLSLYHYHNLDSGGLFDELQIMPRFMEDVFITENREKLSVISIGMLWRNAFICIFCTCQSRWINSDPVWLIYNSLCGTMLCNFSLLSSKI